MAARFDDPLSALAGSIELFQDTWPTEPREFDSKVWESLFTYEHAERLLSLPSLRLPYVRMVAAGKPVPPSAFTGTRSQAHRVIPDAIYPEKVRALYRAGATIILESVEQLDADVAEFCRALQGTLGHQIDANVYLTPAGTQGLPIHWDAQHVFVIPFAGTKHWRVYERVSQGTRGGHPDKDAKLSVIYDDDVYPGKVLFIPAGSPHAAEARADACGHITVTINLSTSADIILDALKSTLKSDRFRRVLSPGHMSDCDLEAIHKVLPELLDSLGAELARAHGRGASTQRSREPIAAETPLQIFER